MRRASEGSHRLPYTDKPHSQDSRDPRHEHNSFRSTLPYALTVLRPLEFLILPSASIERLFRSVHAMAIRTLSQLTHTFTSSWPPWRQYKDRWMLASDPQDPQGAHTDSTGHLIICLCQLQSDRSYHGSHGCLSKLRITEVCQPTIKKQVDNLFTAQVVDDVPYMASQ